MGSLDSSAWITGAILMASGRVPNTASTGVFALLSIPLSSRFDQGRLLVLVFLLLLVGAVGCRQRDPRRDSSQRSGKRRGHRLRSKLDGELMLGLGPLRCATRELAASELGGCAHRRKPV